MIIKIFDPRHHVESDFQVSPNVVFRMIVCTVQQEQILSVSGTIIYIGMPNQGYLGVLHQLYFCDTSCLTFYSTEPLIISDISTIFTTGMNPQKGVICVHISFFSFFSTYDTFSVIFFQYLLMVLMDMFELV